MKRRVNVRVAREMALFAVAACLMGSGCAKPSASSPSSSASSSPTPPSSSSAAQDDGAGHDDGDEGAKLLADQAATAEAKQWLAADSAQHQLWKGSRAEVAKLVDDLYGAGATRVTMAGISRDGGVELSALIVVSLPAAADARAKILEIHNEYWRQTLSDEDPETLEDYLAAEAGQKHLVINFDL